MSDTVLFEINGKVAKITLNRPKSYNAFNREAALTLQGYLDECRDNPAIRAVYLTANGKAFCAGQDLAELQGENAPDLSVIVSEHYNPIISKIRALEKPVICAVNGVAAGAGSSLAVACDITFAAESVTFIQAFSKIGLIPDSGGTYHLPRLLGPQRAAALIMTGDKLTAADAEKYGLIWKCVPDAELQETAFALALKLAEMPTKGLGLSKRLLNETWDNDLETQLAAEEKLQVEASHTYDYHEGVTAFLEKRKPVFKGE